MRKLLALLILCACLNLQAQDPFKHPLTTPNVPWTNKSFDNHPDQFQFAIVSDRTGGHRPGVFGHALKKLNRMHPEFVMSVGDFIEGYTKDTSILNTEWMEFDSIVKHLDMRFFALPGNHDITNEVMRDIWLERYGRSYYHFKYKDVLFLAFDTNDGDGVMFSREQIDYFKEVLSNNTDVRWTLLFMHHPIWNYREFNGFTEIEEVLKNRPYTVFAGHTHRYFATSRQDRNYYLLATTGGGSRLRGPRLGEFDHVTWVTMTDQGPDLLHLQLNGMLEGDLLNQETATLANILGEAAEIHHLVLSGIDGKKQIVFRISNQLAGVHSNESAIRKTLLFEGRFFHNHQLIPTPTSLSANISVEETALLKVDVALLSGTDMGGTDDLELDYSLRFESENPMDPPFLLSGTKNIPFLGTAKGIHLTEQNVFVEKHTVVIESDFPEVPLRYTLDGTDPDSGSTLYEGPISLLKTSTLKVRYCSRDNQYLGPVISRIYTQTTPLPPAKVNDKSMEKGLRYTYFEGDFSEKLPDFEQLTPIDYGIALNSAPNLIGEKNNMRFNQYALRFEGWIDIPEDGIYTFFTSSDDGSKLYLHGQEIVNNDGSHRNQMSKGFIALKKGWAPIRIDYFQYNERQSLNIGMTTPDGKRKDLSFEALWHIKN